MDAPRLGLSELASSQHGGPREEPRSGIFTGLSRLATRQLRAEHTDRLSLVIFLNPGGMERVREGGRKPENGRKLQLITQVSSASFHCPPLSVPILFLQFFVCFDLLKSANLLLVKQAINPGWLAARLVFLSGFLMISEPKIKHIFRGFFFSTSRVLSFCFPRCHLLAEEDWHSCKSTDMGLFFPRSFGMTAGIKRSREEMRGRTTMLLGIKCH